MTRFVKTQREMEGRFEDVWVLVDDDAPDSWPGDARLSIVGHPATRADGPSRAAGASRFTVDIVLPGMLYAGLVRSPVARGQVTRLDLEIARALPGVRAVLGPESELIGDSPFTAEPSWAGEPLAAVAADTPEQLRGALRKLRGALEIEAHPPYADVDRLLAESRFVREPTENVRGDPDAAFASADVRVEITCSTPAVLQTPLEPHAAVARWEAGTLNVWVSTQGIFEARAELCRRFHLRRDQVRVIAECVGGGFGAKMGAGVEAVVASELAWVSGRPVRLVNDRHAEQLSGGRRHWTRQTVQLGARADGTLVAVESAAVIDMGDGGTSFPVNEPALSLYAVENVRAMAFPVRTSLRPHNAFRAPGVTEGITVFEQAIDELAIALQMDPLHLRRVNHVDHDQRSGLPYSSKNLVACYDRAAELADWTGRDALRGTSTDGMLRGMGCASQIWWGGGGPPAHATVRLDQDGYALVTTGTQDIGTGTTTSVRMVAAEELGLPLANVRVAAGDTHPDVYGPVSGGSMTTPAVLPAVRSAASKVRRTLLDLAADVLEIGASDIELRDGRIRSLDGALDIALGEVTQKLGNATIDGSGTRGPNPEGFRVNTFGCQIAQVAVEPATGQVHVERMIAVHDVGRIINPLGASSQVEGGIIQGMALALSEELHVDPTTGVPVNATLDDYKIPTFADVPEIVIDFIDIADPNLPTLGARGLGEPPIVPAAAAIANAFAHATGRRVSALPLTPWRVLEALK